MVPPLSLSTPLRLVRRLVLVLALLLILSLGSQADCVAHVNACLLHTLGF
jgi:hypothetical protein